MLEVASQELWQNIGRVDAVAVGLGEIGGAEIIHHARNAAGLIEIGSISLELRDTGCEAEHESQMSARRAAGDTDAIDVDAELSGIGAKIAYCRFHIVQRGGELKLRSEPVSNCSGHIASLGEPDAERQVALPVSGAEAAAVDTQNRRMRRGGVVSRTHDIQGKLAADGRGIFQIGLEDDVVGHGRPFGLLGGKGGGQYQ